MIEKVDRGTEISSNLKVHFVLFVKLLKWLAHLETDSPLFILYMYI